MQQIPTKRQLNFLNWEFGIFFHFGIRSFYPGHKDWDGIEMPASPAIDTKRFSFTSDGP